MQYNVHFNYCTGRCIYAILKPHKKHTSVGDGLESEGASLCVEGKAEDLHEASADHHHAPIQLNSPIRVQGQKGRGRGLILRNPGKEGSMLVWITPVSHSALWIF